MLINDERQSPVIHVAIAVVRLWANGVGITTKNAPVHIVEVLGFVAIADTEVDAIGKVGRVVVLGPVDAVFLRVQRMGGVALVAVAPLAAALVGSADSPELSACSLSFPMGLGVGGLAGSDDDVVLGVLAEDAIGVDGQAIGPGLDARDLYCTCTDVDVGPVLVRCGVTYLCP